MENERIGMTTFVDTDEVVMNLAVLLERVELGEVIVITSHGLPVAQLIRPTEDHSAAEKAEAIRLIREVASRNRLEGLSIKEMIANGRK
ncbi:type II toxin-antitoxin system prevent-host-death family antitoxin [bacterium]|nr:type II toxin-antitoxin system prevent-host-death family antitoxin [bacterium]